VNHTYGFHLAANLVSADDYSRWRDPNGSDGPYVDWDYCCAGDFDHKNKSDLRAMHANVLNDLMDGKYPMICEFIGKPWPDKPVYYWARWNGIGTLQKYTGSGHDHWSHISWYRSRVDERAHLWTGDDMALTDEDIKKIADKTLDTFLKKQVEVPDTWKVLWPHDEGIQDGTISLLTAWRSGYFHGRQANEELTGGPEALEVPSKLDQILAKDSTVLVGAELLKQVMLDPAVVETYSKAIGDQIVGLRYERTDTN
jgi:hypothetical protein